MAVKRDKPELLAPAGDMERLKMAVLYGADAVYLAGTSFGMRAFAGNFSDEELPQAVAFAHSHGVRVHCTINTMPRNDEAARLPAVSYTHLDVYKRQSGGTAPIAGSSASTRCRTGSPA